jgi:hypothetical protein
MVVLVSRFDVASAGHAVAVPVAGCEDPGVVADVEWGIGIIGDDTAYAVDELALGKWAAVSGIASSHTVNS